MCTLMYITLFLCSAQDPGKLYVGRQTVKTLGIVHLDT